jgi:hypothetical protein
MVAHCRDYPAAVEVGLKALDQNFAAIPSITPATRKRIIEKFREGLGGPAEAKGLN